MHVMRRLGKEGDTETRWEVDDTGAIHEAEVRFDEALSRKMLAFRVEGNDSEQIKKFDPTAAEIILIPQIAGG